MFSGTQLMVESENRVDDITDCQIQSQPGTLHNYKEFDVILLSAILGTVTGDAFDYINEKIFKPLEITNDRWIKSPDGVYYSPALDEKLETVSAMKARDMLKLGQLFLQDGAGRRLVRLPWFWWSISYRFSIPVKNSSNPGHSNQQTASL